MPSAANQFSAACIMITRWWLLAPDLFFCGQQGINGSFSDDPGIDRLAIDGPA
jgi:hypothetical protein